MTNKQRLPLIFTIEPLKIKLAAYIARPFFILLSKILYANSLPKTEEENLHC